MRAINKKGQVQGMAMGKAFIALILAVAIIGMLTIIILNTLGTSDVTFATIGGGLVNLSSPAGMNTTGFNLGINNNSLSTSNVIVTNFSGGELITSGNYTISASGFMNASTASAPFIHKRWNISLSYTYRDNAQIGNISGNVTSGITGFFNNSGTWFALLAIVIIVAIVSVVIFFASRFTGSGTGTPDLPAG